MQESVERCGPHMLAKEERAAADREHRIARPAAVHVAPELVDRLQRTVCDVAAGMSLERRNEPFQTVGRHRVIARGNVYVLAAGTPDTGIPIGVHPLARRL